MVNEINGFKVEKYNQYDLQENARYSTCPLCSHNRKKKQDKCLMLDWDRGLGTCQHCEEVIQLHKFQKKEVKREYKIPTWKNNTKLSNNVVKWFESRGISQFTLRLLKISEGLEWMPQTTKEENTIQFNYFRNSELVNVKYRDGRKNFKLFKDAEKIVYNYDNAALSKDIVIVEGEIDCISFYESGITNCVSVPNGATIGNVNLDWLDNSIEIFENKDKYYLALDSDEAGQNVQKELVRRLGAEKCFLVDLQGCKDANELLVLKGKEGLKQAIDNAKEIPIEGISSINDWRGEFVDYLQNGMQQGFTTGIKSFDDIFSTYSGQYIVVTGKPSSGKSDFVDMMCLGYMQNYGWKTAYASPENKPNKIHAGKLLSKISGKWVNKKSDINSDWCNKAIDLIDSNFKFIDLDGSFDLNVVLDKARQMIFKYGIKILVIDPFNKVRLKESINKNINDYTNDYLLKIDDFARKYDVLPILIAHPRKPSIGEAHVYEPTFYDIKGGGEFYDMSPHGILVHRDYANEMVKIKVLKVKFSHLGENNAHCWLRWNSNNGRYSDFSNQAENAEQTTGIIDDLENWVVENSDKANQVEIFNNDDLEINPNDWKSEGEAPF